MTLANKVRGTVEASELLRGKLVKTMEEEALCCRTSCIYQGEEVQSFSIRSSSESKMACTKRGLHLRMEERSSYTKIEEVKLKASQCEEGYFKAIKGNAKEYQIRGERKPRKGQKSDQNRTKKGSVSKPGKV
nr:hypothetical protein [Tanacetum cinerariifolium]